MTADSPDQSDGIEVAVEEREAWKRRLTVSVPGPRLSATRNRIRRELGSALDIKGFRPGKVPPAIVEQRYGRDVEDRTIRSLIQETLREAIDRKGIRPISDPEISGVQHEKGRSLTYRAEVEIMPALTLERTGGFRIERPDAEVTEEDVEETLRRLRSDNAVWEPADRAPEEGDRVSVVITPADDLEEGGDAEARADPYRFELGEGYALPDVEEAIGQLRPGRAGTFPVSFPEDFGDDEVAGGTRELRIELIDVKAKRPRPLDDDFASEIGDFESLDQLREAVREDLRQHAEREAEQTVRDRLLDSIAEANPFEVPTTMVERYLDEMIDAPEDADPEEVRSARESFREAAEQRIRRQLVLDHLIERENIEAGDEEVDRRIEEIAGRRGESPRQVRRQLAREQGLERLRRQIETDRIFERLEAESGL